VDPVIELLDTEVLSDNWYTLRKFTYRIRRADGTWATHAREAYDRGNGATILLYDTARGTVLLTRQFRLPTYVNGNPTGMMIEACAGLLEDENPEVRIRLELREETGYEVPEIRKVFEAYMSPGSVTEILHFYVAPYSPSHRLDSGGGIDEEDIEVLELAFDRALEMVGSGEIKDAKTIMLLQYAALNLFAQARGALHER
jgi:nudix-type nucleoside diphosphatase (YffH/AdpP family)